MARAAVFVYEEVPVDPAVHAGVQVSDHIVCIICGVKVIDVLWCLEVHRSETTVAKTDSARHVKGTALGKHEGFVRVFLFHQLNSLEVVAGIPVECDTGYHVHGLLVKDGQNVFDHTLFVVIPDEDADLVRQTCFFHLRIQIIFQVGFGLFRCPYAAVPGGSRYGLVLQAQHRHRDSLIEVCLQIFYDVFCPASVILRFQAAAVVSLRNLFRNRHSHCTVNSSIILCDLRCSFPLIRRRPRAHQNTDRLCGDFDGFFQHRKDIFAVAVDREGCQIRVCDRVCDCLILLKGIVTAVDRHADKSCMKAVRSENIL